MTQETIEKLPEGLMDIEAEHALQYMMLSHVERLLAAGEVAIAREVAAQLYELSESHFGSEQVVMRLYSYPGYYAHEREHGDLLTALRQMINDLNNDSALIGAGSIRQWLTSHIHHADYQFMEFMKTKA